MPRSVTPTLGSPPRPMLDDSAPQAIYRTNPIPTPNPKKTSCFHLPLGTHPPNPRPARRKSPTPVPPLRPTPADSAPKAICRTNPIPDLNPKKTSCFHLPLGTHPPNPRPSRRFSATPRPAARLLLLKGGPVGAPTGPAWRLACHPTPPAAASPPAASKIR
jgi:hypothetical protein